MKSKRPAPNRSLFASIRAIRGLSSVFPPSAIRHPHSASGSALILTLLITALLATIAVSFLSTSRVEQIAARNFSRQNAASGLAELATQQAMAKIQKGFTVTGNATTVITTQPGAITQLVFSNGTIISPTRDRAGAGSNRITYPPTVKLFSDNGSSIIAYMNNLQNPSSNSNATSDQYTITGNRSQRLNVFMENVTTTVNATNQTVGRIAYYVDDEGSKLNLNAATGDRPTLNIGSSRSLSLSTLASPTQATNFTQAINGTTNTPSSIQTWAHFFRPEQITGTVERDDIPKLSAAPVQVDPAMVGTNSTSRDYHLKKTPWGTDRLFINDLEIDSANATASVNKIYNALSSSQLRDIYGTTFAEKYTDAGLKQIAANILQARDPNVLNDPNKSFTYNGSLLGATNATTDLSFPSKSLRLQGNGGGGEAPQKFIPKDYLGNVPYPILNEIGVTVVAGFFGDFSDSFEDGKDSALIYPENLMLLIRPFVSIFNPWPVLFTSDNVAKWKIEMQVDSFTYDLEYQVGDSPPPVYNYGPRGYKSNQPYGRNGSSESRNIFSRLNRGKPGDKLTQHTPSGPGRSYYLMNGTAMVGIGSGQSFAEPEPAPSYKKDLAPGEELQFPCPPHIERSDQGNVIFNKSGGVSLFIPPGGKILNISNIKIKFEYIRLLAVDGDDKTIRDWMLGSDVEIECTLQKPISKVAVDGGKVVAVSWPKGFPEDPWNDPIIKANEKAIPTIDQIKPPKYSIKRIGGALKPSVNMSESSNRSRSSMLAWSESGNATWVDPTASGSASSTSTTGNAEAYPSKTKDNEIPGDPTKTDSDLRYAFDPAEHHLKDNGWPKIEFTNPANTTGVFTSPADLGKIQTNIQHRKLRFTTQHPKEVSTRRRGLGNATYIPDWAMLDVISFGSNVTTVPLPAPVNLNGRFYVPSGSPQPAPRTAGLESALKAIDSANSLGNSFNANNTVPIDDRAQYVGSSGNASTIAGHIGNLTWSTGNFTTGIATWGRGNAISDPGSLRRTATFPTNQFVLPSEVTEIRGISDVVSLDNYTGNSTHIKANEGRLSSLFPGATTQSRFFTIYAYAQALDKAGTPDSEAVTKTLVEVIENKSTTPSTYTVKKLYTQPISVQ